MHVAIEEQKKIAMDPIRKAQIKAQSEIQIRALIFDKVFIKILTEYSNYNNIFSAENIVKLLEYNRIYDYTIKLKKGKQPLFGPIYSL